MQFPSPTEPQPTGRMIRLRDELDELGFDLTGSMPWYDLLLEELDYALHPRVHERRIPSVGTIVAPTTDPDTWEEGTELEITRRPIGPMPITGARMFADGLSSFFVREADGNGSIAVFDRPAGSERDLVVIAEVTGATVVQRHPAGQVRVVGSFGLLRWDGIAWHHEPPMSAWIESVSSCEWGNRVVLTDLLEFAVHDLGARGAGAILVYRPTDADTDAFERRLPSPPPLRITRAVDLAPLRHVLSQVDGAAIFDDGGTLRELGVRLIPSGDAVAEVEGYRGMRHTSARRYSYDDPETTVIVVSDDGPVTVWRGGELLGTSVGEASPWPDTSD
ncbi:MAG TPA: diadenylate cyclase [Microthrixaceae bacterium]|nr:diadenylate cyclase [Microthrixaceae bacterium]